MKKCFSGLIPVKKYRLSRLTFSVVLAGLLSYAPATQAESINDQLNNMFGTMSNTTNPGDYRSITREGYTGGGFTLRSKLRTLTPVNIQLPSAAGGCGGIDLFGGSFSFINAEEFVQMLRNLAANASGLAFKLALNAMDAVLDNAISYMQDVVQQMNDLTVNSCQLAKGLLVDTASAFGEDVKTKVSSQLSSDGLLDQFSSFMGGMNGKQTAVAQKEESGKREACKDYGNLMWCLLSEGDFSSQFLGSEQVQKEFIMSLTGSIIVTKDIDTDDTGALIGGAPHHLAYIDTTDALESAINGNNALTIYQCSDTASCPNPNKKEISIDGLAVKIINFFNNEGYLEAVAAGSGTSEAQRRQALFYNTNGAASNAAELARHDINMAKTYINEIAPVLAYSAAFQYINDMLTAADTGARIEIANNNPAAQYFVECQKLIKEARGRLLQSFIVASTRYGNASKIVELRLTYLQALPAKRMEASQTPLSVQ